MGIWTCCAASMTGPCHAAKSLRSVQQGVARSVSSSVSLPAPPPLTPHVCHCHVLYHPSRRVPPWPAPPYPALPCPAPPCPALPCTGLYSQNEMSALKQKMAVVLEKTQTDDKLIAALRTEVSNLRRQAHAASSLPAGGAAPGPGPGYVNGYAYGYAPPPPCPAQAQSPKP